MADWVQNRVAVEGVQNAVAAFFAFDADSTPLLHHLPAPPEDELPMTATVFDAAAVTTDDAFKKAAEHVALKLGTEGAIRIAANWPALEILIQAI